MNNAITKLIAIIRILINCRCRSREDADRLNAMLDEVAREIAMEVEG